MNFALAYPKKCERIYFRIFYLRLKIDFLAKNKPNNFN